MRQVRAGALIRMARGGETKASFAKRAGIDPTSLSRIEADQQDPGFFLTQSLVEKGGCRINLELIGPDLAAKNEALRPVLPFTSDQPVLERMPESLRDPSFVNGASDGPTVSEADYWLGLCQDLCVRVTEPCARLNRSYKSLFTQSEEFNLDRAPIFERDRDLVYALSNSGNGARIAAATLEDAREILGSGHAEGRWGRRSHVQPRIESRSWCRAVYAVRAESEICSAVAKFCRESVLAACLHEESIVRLKDAENALNWMLKENPGPSGANFVEYAQKKFEEASDAETAARKKRDGYGHLGGTPRSEDIGNAGERILAIEFAQLSARAWSLYEKMAGVGDVFAAWHQETGTKLPTRDI